MTVEELTMIGLNGLEKAATDAEIQLDKTVSVPVRHLRQLLSAYDELSQIVPADDEEEDADGVREGVKNELRPVAELVRKLREVIDPVGEKYLNEIYEFVEGAYNS